MPHGGFLLGGPPPDDPQLGMCLLVPSAVLRNYDPNKYLQYTVLAWTSPVAATEMYIDGLFNPPYLGDVCDYFIVKLEPETLDPNYFIDNPGEDPNDYMQMLYTKSNPILPTEADIFSLTTSVEVGTRLLFAVKRNAYTATPASCWPTLDARVYDEPLNITCQDQNEFMKADLNQDCHVNLEDLALLAGDWLKCNDPQGQNCIAPVIPSVLRVDLNGYLTTQTPDNAFWTYEGPGLLGPGTFWNGAEVAQSTPNTISAIYPDPNRYLLDDGITDSQVSITLSGVVYGENLGLNPSSKLLSDYIGGLYADPNIVITISGLIPGNAYTLAGYGANYNDHVGGVWSANGAGPMDLTYYVADQGILPNVIADVDGKIIIEIDEDPILANPVLTVVNGFELQGTFKATAIRTCQTQDMYADTDIDQDCYINLEDYSLFASRWLDCNDPQDETCTATAP